jgi:endonuclease-3
VIDTTIQSMFDRFKQQNPNPVTELNYVNDYTLVIAVLLSAQATDKGVNKATAGLFAIADTPQKMLELGLDGVYSYIKTIGLYNTKGKNIIALSQLLIDKHQGLVPNTREALEELPGVGRKTANVVLNVAFGMPTMAVDTHIFRVSNRTGLAPGKTPRAVEDNLLKRIPNEFLEHAHHWLILHGRYVCKAQNPSCKTCLICDLCDHPQV